MALTRAALEKIDKEELVTLLLGNKDELAGLNKGINSLLTKFDRLEVELRSSKLENQALTKRIINLENQVWKNAQYSRRQCVEIVGLLEDSTEVTVCKLFQKVGAKIDSKKLEACHPLPSDDKNKLIVKFASRKDAELVLKNKSKLKDESFDDIGLEISKVYINESLCKYNKFLWVKCKKLWKEKYINSFRTPNGQLKIRDNNLKIHNIDHIFDLQVLFPNYDFQSD